MEQTPKQLLKVRGKIYELLVKCIPSILIFHKLFTTILGKLDEHCKHKAIKAAAHFESRLNNGTRAIFHLEAFVANLMYIQKEFISYIS